MKVTVSCAGRFHAYNLAAQLERHQVLDKLITTYPAYEVIKYGISKNKLDVFPIWEVLNRGLMKTQKLIGLNQTLFNPGLHFLFEKWSSTRINPETDRYIGWSATSEEGILKARKFGAKTILERGSSHIETQTSLLKDEYHLFGKAGEFKGTHKKVIQKELKEYELADYISVPSTFVKKTFLAKGFPEEKIIQNPYGVNISQFKPGQKQDRVFRIIYVGQMSLRKGVHYLLKAFASLKVENAELILIGGMTTELEKQISSAPAGVKYLGVKPQHELVTYYQQASVFVICSIEEGMAMVQAQAMACGLPVICTTNTGGDDLIRDGKEGFVIPIRDVNAILDRMEWMYQHPEETLQMGQSARKRVESGFTWEDYGNRYYKFLASHA